MAKYKVIDVSYWQGDIDWKKVKADGVVGAIIRYADGTTLDSKFDKNMKGAQAVGLHVGCYIFSRAKTKEGAEKEATRLYNAAKKYNPDMPLYIDLEVKANRKYANKVAQAFIKKMVALGGHPGVYANLNWFNNYLSDTLYKYKDYPMWIAQYYSKISHKHPTLFGMWQYSSSGKVKGIKGKVDMDRCYVAYWDKYKAKPKPTVTPAPAPAPVAKPVVQNSKSVEGMIEWSNKMAKDDKFGYKTWDKNDKKTHTCPICDGTLDLYDKMPSNNLKKGAKGDSVKVIQKFLKKFDGRKITVDGIWGDATTKAVKAFQKKYKLTVDGIWGAKTAKKAKAILKEYLGANCIGAIAMAWHHGGKLGNNCNCHVISDEVGEQIYKAKTDAEALKIAQEKLGLKNIKVIRNGKKNIAKDKLKPGDWCLQFVGDEYKHTWMPISDTHVFDCGGYKDRSRQMAIRKIDNYSARVAIRWLGE